MEKQESVGSRGECSGKGDVSYCKLIRLMKEG